MKKTPAGGSVVVTVRVPAALGHKLAREARRLRRSRSDTVRSLLETGLTGGAGEDPAREARRQSRLASQRASDQDALDFIAGSADLRGWK